jgi:NADH-quinone oxidoreductase subunit N
MLGAFGIVTVLSTAGRDADGLDDYQGLFWRRPVIAGIFTVTLLSLAGIPATMGFLSKFYVLAAGASTTKWVLVITVVTTSTIGLFYYLRILIALYATSFESEASVHPIIPFDGIVLVLLAAVLIWFGVYPAPLVDLISTLTILPGIDLANN